MFLGHISVDMLLPLLLFLLGPLLALPCSSSYPCADGDNGEFEDDDGEEGEEADDADGEDEEDKDPPPTTKTKKTTATTLTRRKTTTRRPATPKALQGAPMADYQKTPVPCEQPGAPAGALHCTSSYDT